MQASPNRNPARTWPRSRASRLPAGASGCGRRVGFAGGGRRIAATARRRWRGGSARRRRRGRGTTSCRARRRTRTRSRGRRRASPRPGPGGRSGSRPRTQKAMPTSSAPRNAAISWASVDQAPDRDERHEHDGGQRREREQRVAGRLAVRPDRQEDVLEEVVAVDPGLVGDRVADRGAAVEERLGLPHEVVVVALPRGVADDVDDQAAGRRSPGRRRPSRRSRSGASAGRLARASVEGPCAILRSTSALVQEADLPGIPHFRSARPRHRGAEAVARGRPDARRDPGRRARPPPHHRIRPAPGLRLRRRPGRVPGLGGRARRARAVRLLRPRLLRRLHPRLPLRAVARRARRAGAIGGHRRPDQAAGDPGRPRPRLARLLVRPRARRIASGRRCSGRSSSWSTRSPGSTARSGARSTRSASIFLLLGAARPVARPPGAGVVLRRRSRRSSSRSSASYLPILAVVLLRRHRLRPAPTAGADRRPTRIGRPSGRRPDRTANRGSTGSATGPLRLVTSAAVGVGDGRRPVPPVRPVARRAARAGRQDRRRLPVRHGQRLQPVGARHPRRQRPRRERPLERSATPPGAKAGRGRDAHRSASRRSTWGRRSCSSAIAVVCAVVVGQRPPVGVVVDDGCRRSDPGRDRRSAPPRGRADRPGDRVLRRPDPGPRALPVPVFAILGAILAATSVALAGRLRRPVAGELRQPLRGPAHTVLPTTRGSRTGWASADAIRSPPGVDRRRRSPMSPSSSGS